MNYTFEDRNFNLTFPIDWSCNNIRSVMTIDVSRETNIQELADENCIPYSHAAEIYDFRFGHLNQIYSSFPTREIKEMEAFTPVKFDYTLEDYYKEKLNRLKNSP